MQRAGLVEIAGGHPALLQHACSLLYSAIESGGTTEINTPQFVHDFVEATKHLFHGAWQHSTDAEKLVMMVIALSRLDGRLNRHKTYQLDDADLILSQYERELQDLVARGILRQAAEQDADAYTFDSSIMEWWVVQEIENIKDDAELAQRQTVLVGLSGKQVEQIKGVMQQVYQRKDAIKAFAEWAVKLVGAFA